MSVQKKVKFLKNHVNGIKKGDVESYDEGRADYLVRVKAAEYVVEKPKVENKKSSAKAKAQKEDKPKADTKKKGDEPCKTC